MDKKILKEPALKSNFDMFMRSLHVLALVQHSGENEKMNYRSMAGLLSLVPWDVQVDEKTVRRCVMNLKKMGFPLATSQGSDRVTIERELSDKEIMEALLYYVSIVSDTIGIRDCFINHIQNHKGRSLWLIARIYFACLEKRRVRLQYIPQRSHELEEYVVNPYRWIFRDNAVYLMAKKTGRDLALFRLDRIRGVEICDETFDDEVPSSEELLRYSLGAYISGRRYEILLRFRSFERERIEEDFGRLDLEFSECGMEGFTEARFTVCDLLSVCRVVFSYGGSAVIVSPKEAVSEMRRLLRLGMDAHKDV